MKGWVKLPREAMDQEWYKNNNVFKLYGHCCYKANYKTNSFETSRSKLAKETGLTIQVVRSGLAELEKTGFITIKITNQITTISICEIDSCKSTVKENNQEETFLTRFLTRSDGSETTKTKDNLTTCSASSCKNKKNKNNQVKDEKITRCLTPSLKEGIKNSKSTSVALLIKNKTKQNKTKENPDGFFSEPYFDEAGQLKSSTFTELRKDIYDILGEATIQLFENSVEELVGEVPDVSRYTDDVITHYVCTYCTEMKFTSTAACSPADKSVKLLNWVKVRYTGSYAVTNILQDIVAYEMYEVFGKNISTDKSKRSKLRYLVKAMTQDNLDDLHRFLEYCKITKPSNIPDIVDYLLNVSSGFHTLYDAYNKHIYGAFYRLK